jgi:hypothetical protein
LAAAAAAAAAAVPFQQHKQRMVLQAPAWSLVRFHHLSGPLPLLHHLAVAAVAAAAAAAPIQQLKLWLVL